MSRRLFTLSSALFLVASLAGCATPPASQQSEAKDAREQPTYRTGSNLPLKDPSMRRGEVDVVSGDGYQNQTSGTSMTRPVLPPTSGR